MAAGGLWGVLHVQLQVAHGVASPSPSPLLHMYPGLGLDAWSLHLHSAVLLFIVVGLRPGGVGVGAWLRAGPPLWPMSAGPTSWRSGCGADSGGVDAVPAWHRETGGERRLQSSLDLLQHGSGPQIKFVNWGAAKVVVRMKFIVNSKYPYWKLKRCQIKNWTSGVWKNKGQSNPEVRGRNEIIKVRPRISEIGNTKAL